MGIGACLGHSLFANSECILYIVVLKPQDVVVALKLIGYGERRPSFVQIASDLSLSPSEVHAAVKRAQAARLLHGPELSNRPNLSALEEFLIHGIKYAFPAERGALTRGIPTSYAAEPLNRLITQDDEPIPIWPYREGQTRGIAFAPLYKMAPVAALRDPLLYEQLALIDAIRDGRPRQRQLAERELARILGRKSYDPSQSSATHRSSETPEATPR
jgi:hypothetical protein